MNRLMLINMLHWSERTDIIMLYSGSSTVDRRPLASALILVYQLTRYWLSFWNVVFNYFEDFVYFIL
jgi:hypothetical protein